MCTYTCACVSCMPACVHAREMTVSSFSTQLLLFKRQYLFLFTAAYTKLAGLAASGVVSLPPPRFWSAKIADTRYGFQHLQESVSYLGPPHICTAALHSVRHAQLSLPSSYSRVLGCDGCHNLIPQTNSVISSPHHPTAARMLSKNKM